MSNAYESLNFREEPLASRLSSSSFRACARGVPRNGLRAAFGDLSRATLQLRRPNLGNVVGWLLKARHAFEIPPSGYGLNFQNSTRSGQLQRRFKPSSEIAGRGARLYSS